MYKRNTRRGFTQNAIICPPCGKSDTVTTKEQKTTLFNSPSSGFQPPFPLMGKDSSPVGERIPAGQVRGYFRGFTLIELLVVVLIIGILAAIAVPQYQKAVEKSRFAEALVTLHSLAQAHQACYLEKGDSCRTEDLTLKLKGRNTANHYFTDKFRYLITTEDVWNNPIWAQVQYEDADVCLCYTQTGEIVLAQHKDNCIGKDNTTNYSTLLNIPDVGDEQGCGCC